MTTAIFNTLAYAKRFKEAGFTEQQAEVQLQVLADVFENNLASKRDLESVEAGLQRDMAELKAGLQRDMAELKAGLQRDMAELKAELKRDITELRAETKRDIAELKTEIIKWIVGLLFVQAGFIIAMLKL